MEHLPNKLLQTIPQVFRDSIPAAGSPSSDSIDDSVARPATVGTPLR